MKDVEDIRKLLERTPVPAVAGDFHQACLKQALLERMQGKAEPMSPWNTVLHARGTKVAAGLLTAFLLVATGWGAERVHKRITRFFTLHEEPVTESTISVPGGMQIVRTTAVGVASDDPEASAEKAVRQHEEMKTLIARREYEYVKTFESDSGGTQYVYRFTLSNGEMLAANFSCPLEEMVSWEEYCKKSQALLEQRNQAIEQALAAGRFRLVNVDVIKKHVCKDPVSGREFDVIQGVEPDGSMVARVFTTTLEMADGGHETSWQDHLQAIADGRRELIDLQVTKYYTYEITLGDGSTTRFSYGGDAPLTKAHE